MTFWASPFRSAALLLGCFLLSSCLPSGQSRVDEEKEPHFLAGKSRVNAMDYKGAIESFERALEVNPKSASAHFELGWLADQKEPDPACAIYHYDHYLKLRPNADNAETVRTRILACKQELARTVSLGPVTQAMQRDWEQLAEDNKHLREDLEKLRRQQSPTNHSSTAPNPARAGQTSAPVQAAPAGARDPNATSAARPAVGGAVSRSHTVRAGENPIVIARKYGLKVETLMTANPGLDARRLQVGQTLNVPAP